MRKEARVSSLVLVLLLTIPGIAAAINPPNQDSNRTPKLFQMFPDDPYPYWVDASQAVDANDYVHGEYFFDEGRSLNAWMATPEENGCIPIEIAQPSLAPDDEHPQVRDTLHDAIATSVQIVQATKPPDSEARFPAPCSLSAPTSRSRESQRRAPFTRSCRLGMCLSEPNRSVNQIQTTFLCRESASRSSF
jgi:hypothetical protein